MSNIVIAQASKLASSLGMEGNGEELMQTLKATAFKGQVSDSQMAALLIVANQYGLSPWTKEIYAFPDKNNGIVPVVGVDGWARIINSHAQFDGIEFEQNAESCTCIIFRKDRSHATKVTEYMIECCRDVGPWKSHPYRMLRHKAMIQCARLAFGFVGIYDRDEAERIVENTSPVERPINPETGEITAKPEALKPYSDEDFQTHLAKWQSLIESGRKTAKQVIATISTKSVLSPEQIAMIESAENIIEA
jgi:phage recombination protein Bet